MQDFFLFEKLAHQNRERIPERGQHAVEGGAEPSELIVTLEIEIDMAIADGNPLSRGKGTAATPPIV